MALKYVRRNDPIGIGSRIAMSGNGNFAKLYQDGPLGQSFLVDPGAAGKGDSLFVDYSAFRVGLIRNGIVTWIAGVFGATGYRDGPGNQALFAFGAAGYPVASAVLVSPTLGYVTDGYNGAIRKLEQQADGSWNVSTFHRGGISIMTADSFGNLWFQDGSYLIRLAPDGTQSSVAATRQRVDKGEMLIWSMCADNVGNIYWHDNQNAASVFYKCGQDMVIHHLCGIDQLEMNQIANSGLQEMMDGDADHCSFHHDNVVMASSDGTEVYMGGGDENFIRRFKDGKSMTLGSDGYWHSFVFYNTDIHLLLNFFPAGWDDEAKKSILLSVGTGLPTSGETWCIFKAIDLVESTDTPFQVLSAAYTDWYNDQLPLKMVAGQTYQFSLAFANGSDVAWTKADGWRCVAADGNPFGVPDQQLDDGESVLPGQMRRFIFTVTPNVPPGKYLCRFGMGYKNLNVYGLSPGDFQIYATQADLDASNVGVTMQGMLDGISGGNVAGWCVDGASPVNVDIIIDGAVAATILADSPRPDLVTAHVAPDPNHGVLWPISDQYKDGKPHSAGIRYNGTMLAYSQGSGSLVSFTISGTTPMPTKLRNVAIDWTVTKQPRPGWPVDANGVAVGKATMANLTTGEVTVIPDITVGSIIMPLEIGKNYSFKMSYTSLDGSLISGTVEGTVLVTDVDQPPPPPAPDVPVPATLGFRLLDVVP